jgi:hypothetical protein
MADDSIGETLSEEMIDVTLADSFPASDPPAWTLGREKRRSSLAENAQQTTKTQVAAIKKKTTK